AGGFESLFKNKDTGNIGSEAWSYPGHGKNQIEDLKRDMPQNDGGADCDRMQLGNDYLGINLEFSGAIDASGFAQLMGNSGQTRNIHRHGEPGELPRGRNHHRD